MYAPVEQRQRIRELLNGLRSRSSPFRFVPLRKDNDTWSFGITRYELERCRWIAPRETGIAAIRFCEQHKLKEVQVVLGDDPAWDIVLREFPWRRHQQ